MLTIRVAFAILVIACGAWAQAPAESELFAFPAPSFSDRPQPTQTEKPFAFKLSLPQNFEKAKGFTLAAHTAVLPEFNTTSVQAPQSRPKTYNYSSGYETRRKIHKYASIATLPLVVSEAIVGQKLIDNRSDDSLRSAHSALAAGLGILFGVESVTGVWNMLEARKNPSGHGKRMFHGILMLAADAGFVATAATAPHHEDNGGSNNRSASTHRAIAYTSFGVATVSYIYMLFAR